jgi:hypothetical protein
MNTKWRPAMGWSYMLTCIADFVVFPILWSLLQAMDKGSVTIQWQPITLQGAGLYHIAMGAVLGVAAYGRTQEKLGGVNYGATQLPSNAGTAYQPVATTQLASAGSVNTSIPGDDFARYRQSEYRAPELATTPSGKKIVPLPDQPLL